MAGRARRGRPPIDRPRFDPACYLCPGTTRANGASNPSYDSTYVFTNDFAALRPDMPTGRLEDGLLLSEGEAGTCRVVCFSPRHDLTLAQMDAGDVRTVVDLWADETTDLGRTYRWVQVFENRGEAMGASNPHPHGQIWAGTALPRIAAREDATSGPPPGRDRPAPVARLRGAGARWAESRRGGRGLAHRRAILGVVAVRDPGHREASDVAAGRSG